MLLLRCDELNKKYIQLNRAMQDQKGLGYFYNDLLTGKAALWNASLVDRDCFLAANLAHLDRADME